MTEHVCGSSGYGLKDTDCCPACMDASPFAVSTGELTEMQIAEARAGCYGVWYQYGSLAWVVFASAEKAQQAREHAKQHGISRETAGIHEATELLALIRLAAMDGYNPKPVSTVDEWVEEAKKRVFLVYLAGRNVVSPLSELPHDSKESR